MRKQLTLSLIIPAYNEQRHLGSCLDSIAKQTAKPEEVIVIDNNSTDNTASVAASYPFVTVLKEKRQGTVFARDNGFNSATSDIIGRINADSFLSEDWVEHTKQVFQDNPELAAVTGPSKSLTIPLVKWWRTTFWSYIYYVCTDAYFRVPILWGANMALTRTYWQQIRQDSVHDDFTHEDQDISLALAKHKGLVLRDHKLLIRVDYGDFHYWPKFKSYMLRRWYTKSKHWDEYQKGEFRLFPLWRSIVIYTLTAIPIAFFATTSFVIYHFMKPFRTKDRSTVHRHTG